MSHKKYTDKFSTTLITERKNVELLHAIGETIPRAYELGLKVLVDIAIENSDKLSSDAISRIAEFRERENETIDKLYISSKAQETVLNTIKQGAKKKRESTIKVWDNSLEKYVTIPESQFDPKWMVRKVTS